MEFNLKTLYHRKGLKITDVENPQLEKTVEEVDGNPLTCMKYVHHVALFAGRHDGKLVVWKYLASGHAGCQGLFLHGHIGPITCLEYFEHGVPSERYGRLVVSGSSDRTIKLWNPWSSDRKELCLQTLKGHGRTVTALHMTSGNTLISCSNDKTIKVWRNGEGRDLLLNPWYTQVQEIAYTKCCPMSLGSRFGEYPMIYVGNSDGTMSVYTCYNIHGFGTYELKSEYEDLHETGINSITILTDQNFVITIAYENRLRVMEATSGRLVVTLENPRKARFVSCDWDVPTRTLFTVDESGYIAIWDIFSERILKSEKLLFVLPLGIHAIPDGHILSVTEASIRHYQVCRDVKFAEFFGHTDAIIGIALLPHDETVIGEEKYIFSCSIDSSIRCWDTYDMKVHYGFSEKTSEITSMVFSPYTNRIITGNEDGSLKIWNPESGSFLTLPNAHSNTVSKLSLAVVGGMEYLLSGGYDGRVKMWDQTSVGLMTTVPVQHINILAYEEGEIVSLCYLPKLTDDEAIITGNNDGTLKVFRVYDGKLMSTVQYENIGIYSLAYDACFLFAGMETGEITIWNCASLGNTYHLSTFTAHDGVVADLIFQLDHIMSCSSDGSIRVWKYEEGNSQCQYEVKHQEPIRCLVYDKYHHQILAGTEDGTLVSFPIPDEFYDNQE